MRTIKRQIVSGLLFSKDNKLLMGKKDHQGGGVYRDCWHIPGGGIEAHESKSEALKREIREETGIDITGYKVTLIDDKNTGKAKKVLKQTGETILVDMHFFVYKVCLIDKNSNEIDVQAHDDLVEYRWFALSEISSITLTPPSVILFKKLGYIQ